MLGADSEEGEQQTGPSEDPSREGGHLKTVVVIGLGGLLPGEVSEAG